MNNIEIISEEYHAREPTWSCGLSGGFLGALGFDDSSLLVHGSSGCGFAMRYGLSQHWKSFIPCPVTSLHEEDVIFGGSDLLERAIAQHVKIYSSEVLFLLTSCSAEIIGEDIFKAAEIASEKYGRQIVGVDVGGASGNTYGGYNNFLVRVVDQLYPAQADRREPDPGSPPQIDVMGIIPYYDMFWRGDIREVKRICRIIGVNVNSVLSGGCSLETVRNAVNTQLTVSVNANIGGRALRRLKNRRLGRVMTCPAAPIGFRYTRKFLMDVAAAVGIDPESIEARITAEERTAREVMLRGFDFSKVMFTAGRVAVVGDPARALPLTDFLVNDLGMRCVLVAFTSEVTEKELEELSMILSLRNNRAKVLVEQDNYLIRKEISDAEPNIVFGRSIDRIAHMTKTVFITWQFPSTDRLVVYDRPYLGYKGIASIVDDVINGFSRIWY